MLICKCNTGFYLTVGLLGWVWLRGFQSKKKLSDVEIKSIPESKECRIFTQRNNDVDLFVKWSNVAEV